MSETLSQDPSIHFVGTYPVVAEGATADTPSAVVNAAAMEEMLKLAGPYIASLPAEATKPNWIASKRTDRPGSQDSDLEVLKQHPALHMLGIHEKPIPKDYLGNEWRYEVTGGGDFAAEPLMAAFEKIYNEPVRDNWEKFEELREQFGRPDLRYQFGLPSPLNPAIFAFRRASTGMSLVNGLLRYQKPFRELYQHVIDTLNTDPTVGTPGKDKTKDFLYQVELPAEIAGINKMPRGIQPVTNGVIADILVKDNVKQIAGFPEGAEVVAHLCEGDWEHKAYSRPNTQLMVDFALSLIRHWPAGRTLNGLHIPLGSGDSQPPLDPRHYEPLAELAAALRGMERPQGAPAPRLILGYIHEDNDLATQAKITGMIERATSENVKHVAPNCGLGRIDKEKARRITNLAKAAIGV